MVYFPAAPPISFADVRLGNGVRLHYVEQGPATAPVIILLHGYSDSSWSFSRVMPLMPPQFRVIALDFRGHGDSDRPAGGYRIADLADDVLLFMDTLKIPSAMIVGHSMGSFAAQLIAEKAPARVTSMVLMGSGPSINNAAVRELCAVVEAMPEPIDRGFVREFQNGTVALPVPQDFMERVFATSERMPTRVWQQIARGFLEYQPPETRSRVRTLVLGGRKDGVFSAAEQTELARQFPDARLELFDEVGHSLHWEEPAIFAEALRRFLQ